MPSGGLNFGLWVGLNNLWDVKIDCTTELRILAVLNFKKQVLHYKVLASVATSHVVMYSKVILLVMCIANNGSGRTRFHVKSYYLTRAMDRSHIIKLYSIADIIIFIY